MPQLVEVKSKVIEWAVSRSGQAAALHDELPKLAQWEKAERVMLTFVELEKLAQKTRTPLGYFFLKLPPKDEMPIPDFRTVTDHDLESLSLDLNDTVFAMQRRQSWYSSYQRERGIAPLEFVGSADEYSPVDSVAKSIRNALGLSEGWGSKIRTFQDAVSSLRQRIEESGILIAIDGVVANNNNRVLSVDEFRGFALVDEFAPLIFINGRDWKSAQVFTMFHELAHVWINQSGVSDLKQVFPQNSTERYCNAVAAEALVPAVEINMLWYSYRETDPDFELLSKHFKVNQIVVARRLLDLELIDGNRFSNFYNSYVGGDLAKNRDTSGGDFYNNQIFKVGKRFMRVVARAANDGALNYSEAYKLTGLTNKTFDKYLARIGGVG